PFREGSLVRFIWFGYTMEPAALQRACWRPGAGPFAGTAAAGCIKKAHGPPAAGQSVQFFYNLPEWREKVFNFCTGAGARETPFLNLIL
ncbi:hypothetical protein, partial [Desulfovibrio sp.]|uniref:hypothetical protein n=1 Tax=Desulfovibrio sp. TaxID=885 RepID=UPI003AAF7B89